MNITRRSLFASAVALLALPRRVAAERLLTAPIQHWRCDVGTAHVPVPMDLSQAAAAMGRAARDSADAMMYAILVSRP